MLYTAPFFPFNRNSQFIMRVRVYRPAKSAAQSGHARCRQWVIEPENATPRTPEPIMGWASAGDTYTEIKGCLRFLSQEDALAFAKNKGWEVFVEEPAERRIRPRNYLDNFRIVRPQDEECTSRFF
jgi:hypothetical protein